MAEGLKTQGGVATRGTARRASRLLKRDDVGGKTGTTNDSLDAWFCGWAGDQVAVGWMGYDTPKPLGARALIPLPHTK